MIEIVSYFPILPTTAAPPSALMPTGERAMKAVNGNGEWRGGGAALSRPLALLPSAIRMEVEVEPEGKATLRSFGRPLGGTNRGRRTRTGKGLEGGKEGRKTMRTEGGGAATVAAMMTRKRRKRTTIQPLLKDRSIL